MKNHNINTEATISVSLVDINRYLRNMRDLLEVHFKLIDLFHKEDELKKHHRAYLHVREQIEDTIRETDPVITNIAAQIIMTLRSITPENLIKDTDSECRDCRCAGCDVDCRECPDAPCSDFGDEDDKDGIICLDMDTYNQLIDDALTLAELVQMVTEMRREDYGFIHRYGKLFPAFAAFERDRLNVYKDAQAEADEIMDRWDDMEEPEEYFSD